MSKAVPSSSHVQTPSLFSWESEPYAFFENADDFPFDFTSATHNAENAWWMAELSLLAHYDVSFVESHLLTLPQFANCQFHWLRRSTEDNTDGDAKEAWTSEGFLLIAPQYSILVIRGLAAVEGVPHGPDVKASDLVQCALPMFKTSTCDGVFQPVYVRDVHKSKLLLSMLADRKERDNQRRSLDSRRATNVDMSGFSSSRTRSRTIPVALPSNPATAVSSSSEISVNYNSITSSRTSRSQSASTIGSPMLSHLRNNNGGICIPGVNQTFFEMSEHLWSQLSLLLPLDRPLFVTGHGVGAAVATLTAFQYQGIVRAVYTFGSPAVATQPFQEAYTRAGLSTKTFRYVHGKDVVATSHSTLRGFSQGANRLAEMGSSITSRLPGATTARNLMWSTWAYASAGLQSTVPRLANDVNNAVDSLVTMSHYCHVGKLKYIERSEQTRSIAQRVITSVLRHDLTDHSPVYYATLCWNNIPGKDARRGLTASVRKLVVDAETREEQRRQPRLKNFEELDPMELDFEDITWDAASFNRAIASSPQYMRDVPGFEVEASEYDEKHKSSVPSHFSDHVDQHHEDHSKVLARPIPQRSSSAEPGPWSRYRKSSNSKDLTLPSFSVLDVLRAQSPAVPPTPNDESEIHSSVSMPVRVSTPESRMRVVMLYKMMQLQQKQAMIKKKTQTP